MHCVKRLRKKWRTGTSVAAAIWRRCWRNWRLWRSGRLPDCSNNAKLKTRRKRGLNATTPIETRNTTKNAGNKLSCRYVLASYFSTNQMTPLSVEAGRNTSGAQDALSANQGARIPTRIRKVEEREQTSAHSAGKQQLARERASRFGRPIRLGRGKRLN